MTEVVAALSRRSTRRPRPRSRTRISWTSGLASTSSGTRMSFATETASSATAPSATEASYGAPRVMCIPLRTSAGSGSCSRPRSSVMPRPAAHAGSRTACTNVDVAACRLLQSSGYRAVRVFREMRIELGARPPIPTWPEGLRVAALTEPDELAFHAAEQVAFAEHWEYISRDFESWSRNHLTSENGSTQPCGASSKQETRSPLARSALPTRTAAGSAKSFSPSPVAQPRDRRGAPRGRVPRLWERGERCVGLGSTRRATLALRLYERAGMTPSRLGDVRVIDDRARCENLVEPSMVREEKR